MARKKRRIFLKKALCIREVSKNSTTSKKKKVKTEKLLCGQNQDLPRPKRNFENSFPNTSQQY